MVSDCLSCPIGSVEASGGSLIPGNACIRRTMAKDASVSAKSSRVIYERLHEDERRGGVRNLLPRQIRGPAWNGMKPGPILASLESSQREGLKEAASAP
jgi:hypothetical protein